MSLNPENWSLNKKDSIIFNSNSNLKKSMSQKYKDIVMYLWKTKLKRIKRKDQNEKVTQ